MRRSTMSVMVVRSVAAMSILALAACGAQDDGDIATDGEALDDATLAEERFELDRGSVDRARFEEPRDYGFLAAIPILDRSNFPLPIGGLYEAPIQKNEAMFRFENVHLRRLGSEAASGVAALDVVSNERKLSAHDLPAVGTVLREEGTGRPYLVLVTWHDEAKLFCYLILPASDAQPGTSAAFDRGRGVVLFVRGEVREGERQETLIAPEGSVFFESSTSMESGVITAIVTADLGRSATPIEIR
jgi:hypothetical protein